jgi:hypothetical protein
MIALLRFAVALRRWMSFQYTLGGHQSRFGTGGEEESLYANQESNLVVQPSLTDWAVLT